MEKLFKFSLSFALLGILLLFIYTENLTLETKDIINITKKDIEKNIGVQGQVTRITDLPGLMILNIKDKTSSITIIVFKEDPVKIKQNDFLQVEGKVTEYKGELEIIAEKIIKK